MRAALGVAVAAAAISCGALLATGGQGTEAQVRAGAPVVSDRTPAAGVPGWQGIGASLRRIAVRDARHGSLAIKVERREGAATYGVRDRRAAGAPVRSTVRGATYQAVALVRAASPGAVGKPVTLSIRERGGGRTVGRRVATTTLGTRFRPVRAILTARGARTILDIVVRQERAADSDAFLVDSLVVRRLAVAGPSPARGRTLTANPGSLQATVDRARPGDQVQLRSGAYPEFVTVEAAGTRLRPITLMPAPGERPVITGRLRLTGRHLRITRLTFRGGTAANPDDALIYVYGASDVEISFNELSGSRLSAIGVWDRPGNRVTIRGNWIHDVGANRFAHGIYYAKGSGGLISGNRIERIQGYGIQAYPNPQNLTIVGNEIAEAGLDSTSCLVVSSDAQGGPLLTSGVTVEGNYAHGCPVHGFRTDWEDPSSGPFGTGNVFRANWARDNPGGDFGMGAPLGDSPATTGALWVGNVVGAPPSGVLVSATEVGPDAP